MEGYRTKFFMYLYLEIKRVWKLFPYFLMEMVAMSIFLGVVAFTASRAFYGEKTLNRIEIGVILPQEDFLSEKAVKMIASFNSVESFCEFEYLNAENCFKKLKEGSLQAVLEIPNGMIKGIVDGKNMPAIVWFSTNSGLEAAVFRELTEAGASLLKTSQSAIYAADDYLYQQNQITMISETERDLNQIFLSYALNREKLFKRKTISAAGSISIPVFYGISVTVFLLLLAGIPVSILFSGENQAFEEELERIGIGRSLHILVKLLSFFTFLLLVIGIVFFIALWNGYAYAEGKTILTLFLVCIVAAEWILLFYEYTKNSLESICSIFIISVIMMFLSGCILPSVFLPEVIKKIGMWTPAAVLRDGIRFIVTVDGSAPIGKLVMMGIIFYIIALISGKRRNK